MDKNTFIQSLDALGPEHEYMSEQQYHIFEAHIRAQLDAMAATHQSAKETFSQGDSKAADPVDKASLDEEREAHLRREASLSINMKKAGAALRAIKSEDYGFCQDCGAEIGLVRLKVAPFTLRDMECERAHEIKQKQNTGANIKVY